MQAVRVGILGFAHGHVSTYCTRWRQHDLGVRVVAGWDHDEARAIAQCKGIGIERAPTIEALLGRPDVDAVVIGAETSMHTDTVVAAAGAGKAVVLQKPIALTMAEADRIVEALRRSKVPSTMAWQMRVDPHNLQTRELLASGRFGRVYIARRRHCLSTHRWPNFAASWHVQTELNRDIFADDASHAVDFLYWLLGMPVSVTAELGTLHDPAVANDNAIAVFRFADGAFGEVSCTFVAPAGENTTEIVCEKGVIIGNYGDAPSSGVPRPPGGIQLKWYLEDEGRWTVSSLQDVKSQGERIAGLAGPLAEFLQGRRPPIGTVEEGRDVLRLILACYESADQGCRVEFA